MNSSSNIVFPHVDRVLSGVDLATPLPLMNVTRLTDMAPQYQAASDDASFPLTLIIGIVLAAAAIAGVVVWYYRTREPDVPTSDALTMELCRAHGLSIYHRGLIDRLATAAGLPHTAALFLSPSHFDAAIERARRSIQLRRYHHGWLKEIRRTIFDV